MASTFHGIETAKRSVLTQQTAINTVGHNISNANTAGYTRQRVTMVASRPMEAFGINRSSSPGQLGTGVEFTAINRIRTAYLDDEFRNQSKFLGSWSIRSETLDKLEAIVNEPSDTGIRKVMDNFYQAWSDLSKDPSNVTARRIVKENATALTDAFNYMSQQLSNLSQDLTTNVSVKANEVQSYLSSIADLNQSIYKIESLGDNANDLRDQRDLLTDKLSNIINITVQNTDQGYSISLGGQALVQGSQVLVQVNAGVTPQEQGAYLEGAYAAGFLNGGEVYGMIFSRENYVKDYSKQLDELADTLANGDIKVTLPKGTVLPVGMSVTTTSGGSVSGALGEDTEVILKGLNGLHQLGYSLDGSTTGSLPFFEGGSPITAANIKLNSLISDNPNLIASSMRTTGTGTDEQVVKGNNTLALLMANLKQTSFLSVDGKREATIDSFYSSIVGQLGVQAQEATRQIQNSTGLVQQVENSRQSISGVSLDEEMSDLIKYQHAYTAAARFMTTYDEMLDKLINSTGTVGR
ncbi:flagellar hook-associated protein FlgK [Paenibacillus nasutitermitis]|uniref:Flagellar hook-associated protein 1 n=1 Tax=Paenibacillus nasutitermitis TaxID=1652958 RepID=A0A917E210_9BACL|nr:flagellar hook-associated protein FlgK [Paenibacillus nasutitermitis]GGD92256.1 flagellar hook-associated protein 1 [Paenibacillus nasutitermitis]